MKLEIGNCLKCGTEIIRNRRPTSLWSQRGYILQNGNILFVALCRNCTLSPDDYKEASRVLALDSPIIGAATRDTEEMVDTLIDILKDNQNGKCFYCGKEIGKKFAISGGHISCEAC